MNLLTGWQKSQVPMCLNSTGTGEIMKVLVFSTKQVAQHTSAAVARDIAVSVRVHPRCKNRFL